MWCINLSFNIETNLRKRFIWEWSNRIEKVIRKIVFFCLYGLDIDTMKAAARGLIDKKHIINEEKGKYLVYDIEDDGYRIKDEHKEKFTKFYTNSKRYEDNKGEFERIFNNIF